MKIETRFNVGDRIFAIKDEKIEYFVVGNISVFYSRGFFQKKYKTRILYATEESMYDHFEEQDCFVTQEEAIKEYNERQNNISMRNKR